ncbi:MAG: PHP domain-containing protein [Acholeplasmataceae bacterium]|nr:PHP domain-containing protein [Acholeplasmataceae bacterium]
MTINPYKLNCKSKSKRIQALSESITFEMKSDEKVMPRENDSNNHIHTTYSFSPYSPTAAAYAAYKSGLKTCGIMDHDTLAGANEFSQACKILKMGYTCGVEMRIKFKLGQWGRMNHPDQLNCAYVTAHGIPSTSIQSFDKFLKPYRLVRLERSKAMVDKINIHFKKYGIYLDFNMDVYEKSEAADNGTITERHILYALATKLEERYGRNSTLIMFLENELGYQLSKKQQKYLLDNDNEYFLYDLLGIIKSKTDFFYIDADSEMPNVEEFIETTKTFGGIPAYAYLGDVIDSVTGDKSPQTFEDHYLEKLIPELKRLGFEAIAYMPTRNTKEQLFRLKKLCKQYQLMEISGEDINSPRQSFHCKALEDPEFSHLVTSTWALIGHERNSEIDIDNGLFSKKSIEQYPNLEDRLSYFEALGKASINHYE